MPDFRGVRVVHQYTQTNQAPPERVFPLLCPVREADWVPGWQYRLIYSQSGVAELGCVFTTPTDDGSESTWLCTGYDPAHFRIAYTWMTPGQVACQIRIQLEPGPGSTTRAHIHYTYTGLSRSGNNEVERFNADWFRTKMEGWGEGNQSLSTHREGNRCSAVGMRIRRAPTPSRVILGGAAL